MASAMKTREKVYAAGVALAVLLIGSFLPIWIAWHFSTWEVVGYRGTLWHALSQLPSTFRDTGPHPGLLEMHVDNLVLGAILILVAGMAGCISYLVSLKYREAA
jgi:hypothetical protein